MLRQTHAKEHHWVIENHVTIFEYLRNKQRQTFANRVAGVKCDEYGYSDTTIPGKTYIVYMYFF